MENTFNMIIGVCVLVLSADKSHPKMYNENDNHTIRKTMCSNSVSAFASLVSVTFLLLLLLPFLIWCARVYFWHGAPCHKHAIMINPHQNVYCLFNHLLYPAKWHGISFSLIALDLICGISSECAQNTNISILYIWNFSLRLFQILSTSPPPAKRQTFGHFVRSLGFALHGQDFRFRWQTHTSQLFVQHNTFTSTWFFIRHGFCYTQPNRWHRAGKVFNSVRDGFPLIALFV